jgi:hypothetical protein
VWAFWKALESPTPLSAYIEISVVRIRAENARTYFDCILYYQVYSDVLLFGGRGSEMAVNNQINFE